MTASYQRRWPSFRSCDHECCAQRKVYSGQLFDFRLLGLVQEDDHLQQSFLQRAVVVSRSVTVFSFPAEHIKRIASQQKTTWLQLLTQDLGRLGSTLFDNQYHSQILRDYIHPHFSPLRSWEEPDLAEAGSGQASLHPLQHLQRTLVKSWNPPWPIGGVISPSPSFDWNLICVAS